MRPVHLLGGLPTDGVGRGVDRIRDVLSVRTLSELAAPTAEVGEELGVLLPPHVETSQVVEEWEACDFLSRRFGDAVCIGNVMTVVDLEVAPDQLASRKPICACGWGASTRDVRAVADIAVGQIESATHLVLIGAAASSRAFLRILGALNPTAVRLALDEASDASLREFATWIHPARGRRCPAGSARVVPPWLELLQAEPGSLCAPDRFVYRRSRPFDPDRFGQWFADPPRQIVRGKGKIWLANDGELSVGYSCAGSVHRVFPAARWWASSSGAPWPTREEDRLRLLDLWHPRFGDRRQELAFVGVDLDPEAVGASLDACLLSEDEALDTALLHSPEEPSGSGVMPGGELN